MDDIEKARAAYERDEPMMQFFAFAHLPSHLSSVSAEFCRLAVLLCDTTTRNPERSAALRKLLEAKDCAVRARIYKEGAR